MPAKQSPIVADAIVPPDQWFDGADPRGIFGGRVVRNGAGVECFERVNGEKVVKLLPVDWRDQAQRQGQKIRKPRRKSH